ncbi:unnamed protein product [Amaranthus hypochondriacus]
MGRAPCCDKANVKRGPWSPQEDTKLKNYIHKFGTGGNWIALPHKIGLKRCGKSCRLRWLNYLRPNIKHGGFTEEEDNIILSLYISIGSRWSIIAAQLPGRTDNDIKNYWNTKLKKKLLGRTKQSHINGSKEDQLSPSALERLQLHMQLQSQQLSLPNPFSPFNNPSICPKLHPQMIQNPSNYNNFDNHQDSGIMGSNNGMIEDHMEDSSLNGSSSSSGLSPNHVNDVTNHGFDALKSNGYSTGMQRVLSCQAEINELIGSDDNKVGNLDFEGINGWWSNDQDYA